MAPAHRVFSAAPAILLASCPAVDSARRSLQLESLDRILERLLSVKLVFQIVRKQLPGDFSKHCYHGGFSIDHELLRLAFHSQSAENVCKGSDALNRTGNAGTILSDHRIDIRARRISESWTKTRSSRTHEGHDSLFCRTSNLRTPSKLTSQTYRSPIRTLELEFWRNF